MNVETQALVYRRVREFFGRRRVCWAKENTDLWTQNFYGSGDCRFTKRELIELILTASRDWRDNDGGPLPSEDVIAQILRDMTFEKPRA